MDFKIGTFFKVPLYVNIFTIIILAILLLFNYFAFLFFLSTLFFIILHEYGHCIMAKELGWEVHDVTIYPIGGVARIIFSHVNPKEELLVAIAGPATSFLFAILFSPLVFIGLTLDDVAILIIGVTCVASNLMIGTFNLLPIFPMDGGRVLRCCLSFKFGHQAATWWTVRFGQVSGFILMALALYYGFYGAALVFMVVCTMAQEEINNLKLFISLDNIRRNISIDLNKPEVMKMNMHQIINEIEAIEDEKLRSKLKADLSENGVSV